MASIVECDMAFHRCIIDASGAEELLGIWLPVVSRMMLHYERLGDWLESSREHATILEAIRRGDKERAPKALEENIR